jgi:hypothetical protein
MAISANSFINRILKRFGCQLYPANTVEEANYLRRIPYATEDEERIMAFCDPYTQTTAERLFSLVRAVQYVSKAKIEGAFVECGVWKGGSVMVMGQMLDTLQDSRDLYLFDTFSGMPPGVDVDVDLDGNDEHWYRTESDQYVHAGKDDQWNAVGLAEVKKNLAKANIQHQRLHFIEGKVEDTLPSQAPEKIALLRLDTDFYESTWHELETLFPRLCKGGVIIVDDYGHFLGARKAVDEYFKEHRINIFMHRIDYTGIIGIK